MRLTTTAGTLLAPLQLALGAAGKHSPLNGVYCETDGKTTTLTATDNEVGVRVTLPMEGEEGVCLLPAKLADILRLSPADADLSLTVGKTLIVKVGEDVYDLPTEDSANFPGLPDMPAANITIHADELREAIDRTAFAAAKEDGTKYTTRAVVWDRDRKGSRLIATDGKRLVVTELGEIGKGTGSWMLPPKAVKLIHGICGEKGEVEAVFRDNDAFFETATATVYTRLVEGTFAPWRDAIPRSEKTTVNLDTAAFVTSVRLAALTSDTEAKRVQCRFRGLEAILCTAEGQPGRSAVRCEPKSHTGPPLDIQFDPSYLSDVSKGGQTVTLSLADEKTAAVFRSEGWMMLVVPLV